MGGLPNGKGDFIYIRSLSGGDTGTQSKWSRFRNIEVGDIGGRVINIANSEYAEFQVTAIRCGSLLGGAAPLTEVVNCSCIDIHPMYSQFYDLPSAWRETISVTDSVGINIHPGVIQSIPVSHNAFSMVAFKGNSQRCNVGALVSNMASYSKQYMSPISSESTCKSICVLGGSFITGAFVSGTPDLNGAGDSYTAINTGDIQPFDSPRLFTSLSNTNTPIATFRERQYILKNVPSTGGALMGVNFIGSNIHCAEIELRIAATTVSGNGSYFSKYKLRFKRASTSTSRVNISAASDVYSDGSASTLSVGVTESHSQFGISINVVPTFGGSYPENACNICVACTINSHYGFTN